LGDVYDSSICCWWCVRGKGVGEIKIVIPEEEGERRRLTKLATRLGRISTEREALQEENADGALLKAVRVIMVWDGILGLHGTINEIAREEGRRKASMV
jgi:hypothetical protein